MDICAGLPATNPGLNHARVPREWVLWLGPVLVQLNRDRRVQIEIGQEGTVEKTQLVTTNRDREGLELPWFSGQ